MEVNRNMTTYNLDVTWRESIRMWKWIVKQGRPWSYTRVENLKTEWLKNHGYRGVESGCFFCHYDSNIERYSPEACYNCPGRKIDDTFSCEDVRYHWVYHPDKFLEKIESLYKKFKKTRWYKKDTRR